MAAQMAELTVVLMAVSMAAYWTDRWVHYSAELWDSLLVALKEPHLVGQMAEQMVATMAAL